MGGIPETWCGHRGLAEGNGRNVHQVLVERGDLVRSSGPGVGNKVWCGIKKDKRPCGRLSWYWNRRVAMLLLLLVRLKLVHLCFVVLLASYYDILVLLETGTGRDEVTTDDVLLKSFEVVDATSDSGLAEHLGGLLE